MDNPVSPPPSYSPSCPQDGSQTISADVRTPGTVLPLSPLFPSPSLNELAEAGPGQHWTDGIFDTSEGGARGGHLPL